MTDKRHSDLFNEDFVITPRGNAVFASGVEYTAKELLLIKTLDKETLKYVHMVKTIIGGTIEGT